MRNPAPDSPIITAPLSRKIAADLSLTEVQEASIYCGYGEQKYLITDGPCVAGGEASIYCGYGEQKYLTTDGPCVAVLR